MDALLLAALAALCWGSASIIEKVGVDGGAPMGGVIARSLGVAAGCAVFAVVWPPAAREFARMSLKSMLCLAGGGVLASIVGQIFFYQALKRSEIGRVAAVGGAWPSVAFILGVVFLSEPLTWKRSAGVLLVGLGVILLR
jgi:uncharacterized membrane protein